MKQMVLTGLSTEQKFGSPAPDFFLVFNDGELRVPITASSAEVVIQAMYGGADSVPEGSDNHEPFDEDLPYSDDDVVDEVGVPQA